LVTEIVFTVICNWWNSTITVITLATPGPCITPQVSYSSPVHSNFFWEWGKWNGTDGKEALGHFILRTKKGKTGQW